MELRAAQQRQARKLLSYSIVTVDEIRELIQLASETGVAELEVQRDALAKAVNYGLSYGQSDFGLARALDVTRTQAAEYSRRYFQRFPTIHKFMEDIVTLARAQGGARTLLGRWRPIPNLMSKSPQARHAAERVAQNTPMQGAGADMGVVPRLLSFSAQPHVLERRCSSRDQSRK